MLYDHSQHRVSLEPSKARAHSTHLNSLFCCLGSDNGIFGIITDCIKERKSESEQLLIQIARSRVERRLVSEDRVS